MICALIMAGGKGTRFWPLSTEEKPKQFLNLIGDRTMIQMTVDRISPMISYEKIFICTGEKYVDLVREQLPEIPVRNIIVEPEGRNTLPCIAVSSMIIDRYYNDSTIVVLPSDHLVKYEGKFRNEIKKANDFIKLNNKAIITCGMEPNRPETGYGYIKTGEKVYEDGNLQIKKVNKFVEKPNMETAKKYLSDGSYLWNGGIFIWNSKNIINEIRTLCNDTYESLQGVLSVEEKDIQDYINKNYCKTQSISIDYAVLEKSDDVYVIPSDIGWDDIGNWEAIERYREKDPFGNIFMGLGAVDKDGEDNVIVATNSEVIIDGLSGIYVIENNGKIIVGNKKNISNVKELKDLL